MVKHGGRITQPGFVQQRRTDIHHDHPLRTQRTRFRYRHVVGQPAIHQQLVTHLYRCKRARHRHAGANGYGQITVGKHPFLAGENIGSHGAKRDRQLAKVGGLPRG